MKPLTPKQREALDIVLEASSGHSNAEEIAFFLSTTLQGAGRTLHGLMARGLVYYADVGKGREWWPTDETREQHRAEKFVERIKARLGYLPSGLQILAASRAELEGKELFERILDALAKAEKGTKP